MRRSITIAAVTALTVAGITGGAAAASADTGGPAAVPEATGVVRVLETHTFRMPSTEHHPVLTLRQDTPVLVQCWTTGQKVDGESLWYRVVSNSVGSFAPPRSVKVLTHIGSIPQCQLG